MNNAILAPHQTEPEPTDSNLWQPKPADATSSQKQAQLRTPPPVDEPVDTVQIRSAPGDGVALNAATSHPFTPVNE